MWGDGLRVSYVRVTIELPRDFVDRIDEVREEMTRQSGKTYTVEETAAVLVVKGFEAVTTELEFEN